uniref:NADH-ubiquinone oxidoreductase chain 6 n=1 Tax=Typhlatya galapagensis TaxID=1173210 RepID=A0A1Z2R6Y8_9EUCA|nr:NADH dehydrogenase subunit 6 [Typhlatya galapagensis]ASA39473.1 NADH dehydrogenase subunit 6 [Typhlatya galapagensis]
MSILTLMTFISSSLSVIFTKITHPLAMGTTLLIQTVIIAVLVSFSLKTTWFSYILFLIFLGAMLVLFIYVASLAPNEPFSISKMLLKVMFIGTLISILFIFMDPTINPIYTLIETSSLAPMQNIKMTSNILSTMYNNMTMKMTLFLILYLLLTLVVVVKIMTTHFGPLRLN